MEEVLAGEGAAQALYYFKLAFNSSAACVVFSIYTLNFAKQVFNSPFCKRGKRGSERLRDTPKVTQIQKWGLNSGLSCELMRLKSWPWGD